VTQWHRSTRVLVLLVAALLVASGWSAIAARSTNSQLTISTDRTSLGVTVGGQAVIGVLVTSGSHNLVTLSISGVPHGSSVQFRPGNRVRPGTRASVSIVTTAATSVGLYPLTITARQGITTRTAIVRLKVVRFLPHVLTISPPSVIVDTGGTATYHVSLGTHLRPRTFMLRLSGLPANVTGSFSPPSLTIGQSATLTIRVGAGAAPGSYQFTVGGWSRFVWTHVSAFLVIAAHTTANFPIHGTGDLAVTPGGPPAAIDLALTNPNGSAMAVTNLGVAVIGTNISGCGVGNYAVIAYSGPASLSVPANSTRTLSQLGVPRAQWPQLRMINLPVNQDICKGAIVQLQYSGLGSGS
jgi:hypothetical protein